MVLPFISGLGPHLKVLIKTNIQLPGFLTNLRISKRISQQFLERLQVTRCDYFLMLTLLVTDSPHGCYIFTMALTHQHTKTIFVAKSP